MELNKELLKQIHIHHIHHIYNINDSISSGIIRHPSSMDPDTLT
jgi:hypothetical protein